jgi:hypothetical protein
MLPAYHQPTTKISKKTTFTRVLIAILRGKSAIGIVKLEERRKGKEKDCGSIVTIFNTL